MWFSHSLCLADAGEPHDLTQSQYTSYANGYVKGLRELLVDSKTLHQPDYTAEDIFEMVDGKNPLHRPLRTMEEALPFLPEGLRTYFSMVFNSGSRQHAKIVKNEKGEITKVLPRIIMYGPRAKLILAYSADPESPGYYDWEIIEMSHDKPARFSKIQFSKDGKEKAQLVQDMNEMKCTDCHGHPPQPNWDAYPNWRNVFGGDDDTIIRGSYEDKLFRTFLKGAKDSPRYAVLKGLDKVNFGLSRTQYLQSLSPPGETIEPINEEADKHGYVLPHLRNALLSMNLGEYQRSQMFGALLARKDFSKFKYALLGVEWCDPFSPAAFLPETLMRSIPVTYDKVLADTKNARSKYFQNLVRETAEGAGVKEELVRGLYANNSFPATHNETLLQEDNIKVAAFRYIVELGMGIPVRQWDTPRGRNQNAFHFGTEDNIDSLLYKLLLEADPGYVNKHETEDREKFCALLKKTSRKALSGIRAPKNHVDEMPIARALVDH